MDRARTNCKADTRNVRVKLPGDRTPRPYRDEMFCGGPQTVPVAGPDEAARDDREFDGAFEDGGAIVGAIVLVAAFVIGVVVGLIVAGQGVS